MDKQIIRDNELSYMDEKGWEDPTIIDLSFKEYSVKKRETTFKRDTILTRDNHINALINNYIGRKLFERSSPDIKKILLDSAQQAFELYLIRKYGSLHNYHKARIKKRWGMKYCQYKNMLAVSLGFRNRNDQELSRAKKRGTANTYNELQLYYINKRGFKTRWEYQKHLNAKKSQMRPSLKT